MPAVEVKPAPSRALVWSALGSVYLIWGSTYLAIRVAVETLPPLLMSSARFLFAGVLLYALTIGRGDAAGDRPTAAHWRSAFIVGGALLLGGNGGVVIAEQRLASAHTALLIATVPIWMTLLDRILFRERLPAVAQTGLAIGFFGIVLLVRPWSAGGASLHVPSALLVVGASLSWACGSLYARRAPFPKRALVTTAMQMIAGGTLQGVVGLARGELGGADFAAFSGRSLVALAYLVAFGSLIAFTAYSWLLRNTPTSLAGTYAYVNPVVAVVLGALILNERITGLDLLAGCVIVAAVTLIVTARSLSPKEEPAGSPADAPPPAAD